jgi:hypothetical protein
MQEYVVIIIDSKGNEHPNVTVQIADHVDYWQDVLSEISEKATEWCSDEGLSYETWEFQND